MDLFNRAYSQLHDLFRSMTPGGRLTAGLLAAVVLLSLGYLLNHQASQPDVDLMHGVPIIAAQLPEMEAAIAKANLKGYEIHGTSIRVPRGQEAAYMAALADAKVLPPNFGNALRQAISAGTPFEDHRQREQRLKIATQDELALIIRSMPGIESASVLYDVDSKPGFNKDKLITAAASVKPAGSSQLDEGRVSAIRHLVAGAIAGLKPENVTVSDLNGRTWYPDPENPAGADENTYVSLKRTCEQDLKAKILNALCFIPNVTVEPSVVLDRQRVARTARVSVGVPISYFKKVWQERNPVDAGRAPRTPDPAALDQIRLDESAKIQRHVAQLLPPADGLANAMESVTVTTFQDIPLSEPPAPSFGQELGRWAAQSWGMLGTIAVALASLLVLRSMVRARPAAADAPAISRGADPQSDMAHGASAQVPPPHGRRFRNAAPTPTVREELSQLVERDPDAAANILRGWIGQID